MKPPKDPKQVLFGGTFVLANKLQNVGDKLVSGLSVKQWFLLRNIIDLPDKPAPTITQIAYAMDSTRQNITKMLEAMEREGLVRIEKNASDRRSRSVSITESGLALMEQTFISGKQFLDRLYEGIAPDEFDAAVKVKLKMIRNLQNMQEEIL